VDIITKNIEVIRFLRNRLSGTDNRPQSTTPFSDRLVYEGARVSRAKLLSDKMREKEDVNLENYQTIGCIPIDEVDVVECPCAPRSGCTFRIAEFDIPTPIGKLFNVNSIDGSINYSYVEWDRFKYKINGRRSSSRGRGYYTSKNTKNGVRLYLYNDVHKEYISVTSIFADPIKIYQYPNCDGTKIKCADPLEYPFPMDPDLLGMVYEMAAQFLRPLAPTADKLNNESDDVYSETPIR
jgi:hypothetical protein